MAGMRGRGGRSRLGLAHSRHVVPRRHGRRGLGLTHGRHVMTGMSRRGGWSGLRLGHRRHVVSRRHGRRRPGLAHGRHVVPRRHRPSLQTDGHRARRARRRSGRPYPGCIGGGGAARDATLRKRLANRRGRCMPGVALRQRRRSRRRGGRGEDQGKDGDRRLHDAAPSIGRTVTTLNIPACMCSNR